MKREYNRGEVESSADNEAKAQDYMDIVYMGRGWQVDRSVACKKYDLKINKLERNILLEEKFRDGDFGDFLVELMQAVEVGELGWFYHCEANYVNYVVCTPQWKPVKMYAVKWNKFKDWFCEYLKENRKPETPVSPKGIGISLNVAVDWSFIPAELYFEINCSQYLDDFS